LSEVLAGITRASLEGALAGTTEERVGVITLSAGVLPAIAVTSPSEVLFGTGEDSLVGAGVTEVLGWIGVLLEAQETSLEGV
jgi:hypothetical protein